MSVQRPSRPTLPILGILAEPHQEKDGEAFGPLTSYIRDVAEAARVTGRPAYVFSSRDVLRQRTMVWGWSRVNGRWSRDFFPVPKVVYAQLGNPTRQDLEILRWLREREGALCVNHPDLDAIVADRWRLLHIAMSHPSVSRVVPEPVLLRSDQSLDQLLSDGRRYLVRSRFRTGAQPVVCQQGGQEGAEVSVQGQSSESLQTFKSTVRLREYLESLSGELLVQPYEQPLRYHGHPILIRSVWQRNPQRQWQETVAVARIGPAGAFVGPFTTVSELDRFQPILQELLGKRARSTIYQVTTLGGSVAKLLHERSHGAGEVAIDCWITAQGVARLYDATTVGGGMAVRSLRQPAAKQRLIQAILGYIRSLEEVLPTSVPNRGAVHTQTVTS